MEPRPFTREETANLLLLLDTVEHALVFATEALRLGTTGQLEQALRDLECAIEAIDHWRSRQ